MSVFLAVSVAVYVPTYQLLWLCACLPACLSVWICVIPLGHQVHLCHSQTPDTLPNPQLCFTSSIWHPVATAGLCCDKERLCSAPIIRDKDREKALVLVAFLCLYCGYRLQPHMKEIIIKSISRIFLSRLLIKMFKVIANLKNTITHIAFDNRKPLMGRRHLCLIFSFFSTPICHYFRFNSSQSQVNINETLKSDYTRPHQVFGSKTRRIYKIKEAP